jgi:hypothetical protein
VFLLSKYRRFNPACSQATPDRAPDHLADRTPAASRDDLISLLGPSAVRSRVTDLVRYATDASPYRFFPQVVIVAESVEQIVKTLQYAKQNHSMHTLGNDTTLRKNAAQLADKPFYPLTSTCCAFAGDRGLLHEELTRSATLDEAQEVMHQDLDLYICANRTCEVELEHATRAP